ncbi:hypothetical protein AGMMS50276_32150 [Synergistales bacterium]|nr:hypothetical protein AGMMS50276_32150 [Synergistales bacterium]
MTDYKIAIMGATGSGKTIFFGSYFYSVIGKAQGEFPVSSSNPVSVRAITDIVTTLFEEHVPLMGTSERTDISFNVQALDMRVTLHDIPGGYTQDAAQWAEQKITPDLESANAVLFFISGEDLVHNGVKCFRDNAAFTSAISEHVRKKIKGSREDVPIWFIFTKGDLISDTSLEDLKELNKGLHRQAEIGDPGSLFYKTGT